MCIAYSEAVSVLVQMFLVHVFEEHGVLHHYISCLCNWVNMGSPTKDTSFDGHPTVVLPPFQNKSYVLENPWDLARTFI